VDLEARVRTDHPLRVIKSIVNEALSSLEREFASLYSPIGRPSIPPEKLLRAMLLQAFYSIRSERQLMERLEFDLLFRWFVGLGVDDPAWDHSVFSKNRARLLEGAIAAKFLGEVLAPPRVKKLLSTDHFSVDGTLIEAWASMKSFKSRDSSEEPPPGGGRNSEANFHGRKRSNETHASTTDPDAKLYRKGPGKEAKLCFMGHGLMENRFGLLVGTCLTPANGHAERVAALAMIEPHADGAQVITLGADKAYDAEDFVNELRSMRVTPHVAQNTSVDVRRSTGGQRGMAVMRSASESASGSRRPSAGSRPSLASRRPSSVELIASAGSSTSPPLPTIWCDYPSCSLRPTDGEGIAYSPRSSLADARSPRRIQGTTISSSSSSRRDLTAFFNSLLDARATVRACARHCGSGP